LHFTLSDELILFKYWRKTKKKKKERENLTSTHIALKQITLEHTEAFLYVMMMVVVLSICALAGALDQVLRVPTP
jgi:cell division protein FtsL